MFSWIYSWSRFRERKIIFYFPRVHRRLITRCASHFNPVLIIKFGFSQFFPLAAHQGLMRYPKMSTWGGLCINLLAQGYKSCEPNLENTSKIHRMPRYPPCNKKVSIILSKRCKTQPDICHAFPFSYINKFVDPILRIQY